MKNIILMLGVLLAITSCDTVKTDPNHLEGTYIGYFHCNRQDTARVTLHFSDNAFRSESTAALYSVIGNGTFSQQPQTIQFVEAIEGKINGNKAVVLSGQYNYQANPDGTIRIWREKDDQLDEYILIHAADQTTASLYP